MICRKDLIAHLGSITAAERGLLEELLPQACSSEGCIQCTGRWFNAFQLFPFVTNVSSPIDEEYLERKGALLVPCDCIRNEFLYSYLDYVYPLLPVVDLAAFPFRQVISEGPNDITHPSLLLLQSLIFAGSLFVAEDTLQRLGYEGRQEATESFFLRAKVRYAHTSPMCFNFFTTVSHTGAVYLISCYLASGFHHNNDHIDIAVVYV